jgi:hypothetical protein
MLGDTDVRKCISAGKIVSPTEHKKHYRTFGSGFFLSLVDTIKLFPARDTASATPKEPLESGCSFGLMLLVQSLVAPQRHFHQNMTNLGEILMVIPLFFPAIGIGMIAANLFVWLIPPARAALKAILELTSYRV